MIDLEEVQAHAVEHGSGAGPGDLSAFKCLALDQDTMEVIVRLTWAETYEEDDWSEVVLMTLEEGEEWWLVVEYLDDRTRPDMAAAILEGRKACSATS